MIIGVIDSIESFKIPVQPFSELITVEGGTIEHPLLSCLKASLLDNLITSPDTIRSTLSDGTVYVVPVKVIISPSQPNGLSIEPPPPWAII